MYAYYCLHKLRMLPSEFTNLPRKEKAFVIAAISYRVEQEETARRKAKSGKG